MKLPSGIDIQQTALFRSCSSVLLHVLPMRTDSKTCKPTGLGSWRCS